MLIEEIKNANLTALKEKDTNTRAILSIVINRYNLLEIELKAKDEKIADSDLVQIIQKVARELIEEKEGYLKVGNTLKAEEIDEQAEVLKRYLPKMLSRAEIESEINKLADRSIPNVMKHFKTNFAGQVDMKLVNEVLRSLN